MGGGVQRALEAGFKKVISIEISEKYFNYSFNRFADNNRVSLFLGDSLKVLPWIIEPINEPITFFLDGHFFSQSPAIVDNHQLAAIEVPLLQELEIIKEHPIKTHTILIDDRRVFGQTNIPGEIVKDWGKFSEDLVIHYILDINPKYKISYMDSANGNNDILVAEIKE